MRLGQIERERLIAISGNHVDTVEHFPIRSFMLGHEGEVVGDERER